VTYSVWISHAARRHLRALHPDLRNAVIHAALALAGDPRPPGAKQLKGELRGVWRLRVGDYRASYLIDDVARVVRLSRVGHRSTFYKRLKGE
jgi:mRNA interferase RelE/StbE